MLGRRPQRGAMPPAAYVSRPQASLAHGGLTTTHRGTTWLHLLPDVPWPRRNTAFMQTISVIIIGQIGL
jgi:hypothetical protein